MNILFYVEPLIERDDPYWKEGWVSKWSSKLAKIVSEFEERSYSCIILNEALSMICKLEAFNKSIILTQNELTNNAKYTAEELLSFWYRNNATKNLCDYYKNLLKGKIDSFIPDIIITFTPIPFLKELYPKAKILYFEYSFISRLPFHETWFLDPCGVYDYSYLNQYASYIKQYKLNEKEKLLLNKLKKTCKEVFLNNNPFKERINKIKNDYNKVILLPLQFSRYYSFDCQVKFKSQYEYMIYILDNLPKNIAIIITMHPQHSEINKNAIDFVRKKYSNVFIFDDIVDYDACSQYFLPLVDIVITTTSSTGLQTLLFDNKLITFGNAFNFISDGDFDDFDKIIRRRKNEEKDKILFFLLTRYAISSKYLFNVNWLEKYFKHAINTFNLLDFYKVIDDSDKIISSLCKLLLERKQNLPYKSIKKLKKEEEVLKLILLKNRIIEKDKEIDSKNKELSDIKNSRGYKLLKKYYNFRDRILPMGSKRRKLVKFIINKLKIKLKLKYKGYR